MFTKVQITAIVLSGSILYLNARTGKYMSFAVDIPVNFARNTEEKAKEITPVVASLICQNQTPATDTQVALIPANASVEDIEKVLGKGCPISPGVIRWARTGGKPDLEVQASPEI